MSEDKKNSKKKDELLDILKNVKRDAHDITSKGREIVEKGQYMSDLASCNEEYIRCLPNDSALSQKQWDTQINSWGRLHNVATSAIDIYGKMDHLNFATDSTSVSSSAAISTVAIPNLPPPSQEPARQAFARFSNIIEKSNQIKEIEHEIDRLGLTVSPLNRESILSLLSQAEKSFKAPSVLGVSPTAVLIPIREAINRAFADLLPKRLKQETAKRIHEKVQSMCSQCSHDEVDNTQIELLATEAFDLINLLSTAKQETMNRETVREYMNRGFLFLRSFLRTLDENKLKK